MTTVITWSGREARALREALRMSLRDFADRLGIAERTVAYWEAQGSRTTPRPSYQAVLDTALSRASAPERERFDLLCGRASPTRAAPGSQNLDAALRETEAVQLEQHLFLARRVDDELIRLLSVQTENIRLQDRRLGAAALREQITAHIDLMHSLLLHSTGRRARTRLATVLADTSTLAAWQALDLGLFQTSWRLFETAKVAAREAGSPAHYAHAAAEQAYVLSDLGHPDQAGELVDTVLADYNHQVAARLRSWMHGVRAEISSAEGNEHHARLALDEADRLLPEGPGDPDLPFLALDASHLARWRGHCHARLGLSGALDDASLALDVMDHSFTRAEAGLRCDYAAALIHAGEREEAAQQLERALFLATATGSVRQRNRISATRALLAQREQIQQRHEGAAVPDFALGDQP